MKKTESLKIIHHSALPDKNPKMQAVETAIVLPDEIDEVHFLEDLETDGQFQKLEYRAKLFAIHYCKDFNATAAAVLAGYSKKSAHSQGYQLLKDPGVQLAILKRQQALASVATISREWVLTELTEIIEDCRLADKPDRQLQIKALDMISRLAGYYNADIQVNVQNNIESIKIEIIKADESTRD